MGRAKGIDGLAMLAQQVLAEDPFGGALSANGQPRFGIAPDIIINNWIVG